jgi:hypothetical protein
MHVFTIALVLYLFLSNVTALLADVVGRRAFKPPLVPRRKGGGPSLRHQLWAMVRGG